MDIKNVMSQVPKIHVNSLARDALSNMGTAADKAIVVNPNTRQILGITERWRLERAEAERTIEEQLTEKPYIIARAPAVPANYEVSQIEEHFPRAPGVVVVGEDGEPIGMITLGDTYKARRGDIEKL